MTPWQQATYYLLTIFYVMTDDSLHEGVIMSVSWTKAGTLVATCAKDKVVRVIDPRGKQIITSAQSHDNTKDSRVLWLGDSPYILTTGFDSVSLLYHLM